MPDTAKFDFLVVGAGLFGATFARLMKEKGAKVFVIERRPNVGGNIADTKKQGINVHLYGPHIFHTNDEQVYRFLQRFTEFNSYRHRVIAHFQGKTYPIPVNLTTLERRLGITTEEEAQRYFRENCPAITKPANFEQSLLAKVGPVLYRDFFEEYTQKQWNRPARELPPETGERVPVRTDRNDEYFSDRYQGVSYSFTNMILRMLVGIEVSLETDFFSLSNWRSIAKRLIFTGEIDQWFGYSQGRLEYIRLHFEEKFLPEMDCFQETAVVNYPEKQFSWTRVTEHKHFLKQASKGTILTYEYPDLITGVPCYPVPTEANRDLYRRYRAMLPPDVFCRWAAWIVRIPRHGQDGPQGNGLGRATGLIPPTINFCLILHIPLPF
jgi:UDP-galactopyranose mutase